MAGPTIGFPVERLSEIPAGTYTVQALLHRYETFRRSDGHTVKMPMDRGEGQQWNLAPGNLYSTPRQITLDPAHERRHRDHARPGDPGHPAAEGHEVRQARAHPEQLLTKFWGRPMHIGAARAAARGLGHAPAGEYPLFIYHGHFPATISGWRETPPDPEPGARLLARGSA